MAKNKDKIPNCVFAQPSYWWRNTEPSGFINDKAVDFRGYWILEGVLCTFFDKNIDKTFKKLGCFHWCKTPEKCDMKKEGKPQNPIFSYTSLRRS